MERARWSDSCPFGTASNVRRFRDMPIEFYFTPELHLKDGRIIRDLEDAASFCSRARASPRNRSARRGLTQVRTGGQSGDRPCCSTLLRAMGGGTRSSGLAASSFVGTPPRRRDDRLGCRDKIERPSQAPSREFD